MTKVLFVDDDVDDREFFKDALSYVDPSINCMVAKNCDEAFKILEAADPLPDFAFLDIFMPPIDGKSCLIKIKDDVRFQNIKVVMYSNSSDEMLMQEYKQLGATYFLVKPSTFKGLCDSLSVLFAK